MTNPALHLNLINNEWTSPLQARLLNKKNPWSSENGHENNAENFLAEVAKSDVMDLVSSLKFLKISQPQYQQWSLEQRIQLLLQISELIDHEAESIAEQESFYQGLPISFTLEQGVKWVSKFALHIADQLKARKIFDETAASTMRESFFPQGSSAIIAAWPLCFRLIGERLLPALASGNCCYVKPSEHSSISGQIWGNLLLKTGLPAGTVQILQGAEDISKALVLHPAIKSFAFVGKNQTAKKMVAELSKGNALFEKKYSFSMGARNSLIFLPGMDLQQVQSAVRCFLIGQGQTCWNAGRVFILESERPTLLPLIEEVFQNQKMNLAFQSSSQVNPQNADSLWTPMITESVAQQAMELKEILQREEGRILSGGQRKGNYVNPLVVLDLPNCSTYQQDECPVLNITSVKYTHEIAKWVNTSYLGHSAVIFGDPTKAQKLAAQLNVDQVFINDWMEGLKEPTIILGNKESHFGNDFRSAFAPVWTQQNHF